MTTTHIEPPQDLPSGPGILRALVVPFNEPIQGPHKDAGHRFTWATVRAPADPEKVSMNLDHDSSEVGMIVAAVKRSDGIWASIKVGLTAERLIAAGRIGVSPEISADGELTGVALCVKGHAGLPSAKIVDTLPSFPGAEAPAERASTPSFLPVALGSGRAADVATRYSGPAWGHVEGKSRTLTGNGGKASDSGPAEWRAPSPFAGRPVLLTPDPDLEAATARRRFEEIRAGRKEWDEWPETFLRQHRKNYRILCEQFEAERAAEQRRKAELARDAAELKAAIQAIASPRRWWQWWRS